MVALVVKNPPVNSGDVRDGGSIPGSGRSSGGGHGNLLQYSCLENPMDRGAWWASVHKATKSQTQLSNLASNELSSQAIPFPPLSHHNSEDQGLRTSPKSLLTLWLLRAPGE